MLRLVVLLKAVIGDLNIGGNDETILRWIKWPEVCAKYHHAEVDIDVMMILLHAFFERVRQIFAEAHVCNIN
jgi:hypothetical protein